MAALHQFIEFRKAKVFGCSTIRLRSTILPLQTGTLREGVVRINHSVGSFNLTL